MAGFLKAGEPGLAPADLADPRIGAQRNKGRVLPAELPVIRIQNMPWNHRTVGGSIPSAENCHVRHNTSDFSTIGNLRSFCKKGAHEWQAVWQHIPEGFDHDNLIVYAEMDGANRQLRISPVWNTPARLRVTGVETLTPLMVRDVLGKNTPDVLIECIRYEPWSAEKTDEPPYQDCLPES